LLNLLSTILLQVQKTKEYDQKGIKLKRFHWKMGRSEVYGQGSILSKESSKKNGIGQLQENYLAIAPNNMIAKAT